MLQCFMPFTQLRSVDVCTSAHNEEGAIDPFMSAILELFHRYPNYAWRLIIVDNGSQDATWDKIEEIARQDSRIKGIKLTRNFGFESAIMAALDSSNADASIMMASDLQDNPNQIPLFIERFENGYDHVFQVVNDRPSISSTRRLLTKLFYQWGSFLTSGKITPNATDFRMISKRLRDLLMQTPDRSRLNRAILNFFAFRFAAIEIPRGYRETGRSKTNFKFALSLGIRGIFANSKRLLDYVGLLSLWMVGITGLTLFASVFLFIFIGVPFGGFGTIVGLLLLLFAFNFLALGIISQYLAIIMEIVQKRPIFVVDRTIN